MTALGFEQHDHDTCIASALNTVETCCARDGLQFTPVRRRVLEIMLQEHSAMGAYEILEFLAKDGLGSQPPVVYRALDFLVKHGFAHRIEQLNAYTACAHPDRDHVPAFLICRRCKSVVETETAIEQGRLGTTARGLGFTIERVVLEAEGLCPVCVESQR